MGTGLHRGNGGNGLEHFLGTSGENKTPASQLCFAKCTNYDGLLEQAVTEISARLWPATYLALIKRSNASR